MTEPKVLQKHIDQLRKICGRFGIISVDRELDICQALLKEEKQIPIGVFGRFKAGKSSFLNTICQREILPVGVTPVTTVITRLYYDANEQIFVEYMDGRREPISIDLLPSFVTEEGNPDNSKQVAAVNVGLRELSQYQSLEWVDTPGLGSAFEHNTRVSLDWLPNVGAALVAISVDPPLSSEDIKLIRDLLRYTPRIVILLTKTDLLQPEQVLEVVTFIRTQLEKAFGEKFPIYAYSTRKDLAVLRDRIDHALFFPLISNRGTEVQAILKHKLRSALRQCEGYLQVALAASKRADLDRGQLKSSVLGEKTNIQLTQQEFRRIGLDLSGEARPHILNLFRAHERELVLKLTEELAAQLGKWDLNLWKLTQAYDDWMRESFGREFRMLSLAERENILNYLTRAKVIFGRAVEAFHRRLADDVEKTLGVKLPIQDFSVELVTPKEPDISISRAFEFQLALLWFLIPMSIFGKPIRSHFIKSIPDEVEKNISRLASQWAEQILKQVSSIEDQARSHIARQLSTIESVLSQSSSSTAQLQEALQNTSRIKNELGQYPPLQT